MNRLGAVSVALLVALITGCSATAKRGEPAPVEDAGEGTAPATHSLQEERALDFVIDSHQPESRDETSHRTVVPGPAPEIVPGTQSKAVLALAEDAERLRGGGEFNRAAASLERALRIEPRNPYLWNRLARLRLDQGRYGEAADLAAKSNALAGKSTALKKDNWSMIALARRSAGDLAGARAAERKAQGR